MHSDLIIFMYNFSNTRINAILATTLLGLVDWFLFYFFNSKFDFHFTVAIVFIYLFAAQILFIIGIINAVKSKNIRLLLTKILDGILLVILTIMYRFIFPI